MCGRTFMAARVDRRRPEPALGRRPVKDETSGPTGPTVDRIAGSRATVPVGPPPSRTRRRGVPEVDSPGPATARRPFPFHHAADAISNLVCRPGRQEFEKTLERVYDAMSV